MKLAGDVAKRKAFFFGKGNCSTCHMVRGIGGVQGPDLSQIGRQLTLGEIEQALDDPDAPRVKSHAVTGCPSVGLLSPEYVGHGGSASERWIDGAPVSREKPLRLCWPLDFGLTAEEVEEVYPDLVARSQDGQIETIMYQNSRRSCSMRCRS
jgi:hypothetical protein